MILIYSVCEDKDEAEKIGESLVEEKLAACTNTWDINSIYRWDGETQKDEEAALLVKTREDLVSDVFAKIRELHSYDTPAILAIPLSFVDDDYLEWVTKATRDEDIS